MVAEIFIKGTIGDFDEGEFTDLVSVVAQVNKQKNATSYDVYIDTIGGYVSIGKDIRKYMMGLNLPIRTIGHGTVASIGTVLYSMGSVRELKWGTRFMIHLPSGKVEGTSEEILEYSNYIQKEEKDIINIYNEVTGLSKEVLKPLLSNETWLDPTRAYELGFSTVEPVEMKAVAKYNKPVNKDDKMSEKQKLNPAEQKMFKGFMDRLTTMFSGEPVKNIVIQTSVAEVELDFTEVMEGEQVAVDAIATISGQPAEGEHVLPSGETYVFMAGVLTEIKPKEDEAGEDKAFEELKAVFKALELTNKANEDKLATEKLRADEAIAKLTESTTKLSTAKVEFDKFKSELKSNFDFTAMKADGKKPKEETGRSDNSEMMANLKKLKAERNKR